jgi:Gpi18-like mannosyltransferase
MKYLDEILDSKIKIGGVLFRMVDLFFLAFIFAMGICVRWFLFDFLSGDYYHFVGPWMEECHKAGGWAYLGITPSKNGDSTINYGCMYQYIIVLLHYIGGNDMHLVKAVSVIFDVVCAVTIFRITYHVNDGDVSRSSMAFAIAMLLPTSVLNSGAWAQCDSIYTAFVLLSFLHVLKKNNMRIFIYFALAYSFKQQAVFIIPFLIIMWLKSEIKTRFILIVPVILIVTMIPAMIAGRDFFELASVYSRQVETYTRLTMNYPSIYTVISTSLPVETRRMIIAAGTTVTVAMLAFVAYRIRDRKFAMTGQYMVTLAIFTIQLTLFVLPVMHERYGYLPEMLAVVYAVMGYKRAAVCAVMQFVSIVTYSRFLFGTTVDKLWVLTVMLLVVIFVLGKDLYDQMNTSEVADA